ncbi:MAG: hypothetical protein SWQ30_21465 [Thermodesulfobacteriota bacterium]|nr:hypothetical protein [Thermodesulfobacteriota bacterium]
MKPESTMISPVYFPFTVIDPSFLEALSRCLGRVVLYRPVGSPPVQALQAGSDRFLEIRVPFEDIIDKEALVGELQQWKTWGLMSQDADMAYLKAVGGQMAPADPLIPKIASQIKASGENVGKRGEMFRDSDLAPQLFLHLAQDYDERSLELREHLDRFKLQEQALQDFFRIDRTEESEIPMPGAALVDSDTDPGGFMIENRMSAWNHLFQKDHDGSAVLFTDSPVAHAWLLEGAQERLELLKRGIPCIGEPQKKAPWGPRLEEIFGALLTTEWSDQLGRELELAGRDIEEMIKAWEASLGPPGERTPRIRWSVVPGLPPCSLLQKRWGLKAGPEHRGCAKNSIIGLVL